MAEVTADGDIIVGRPRPKNNPLIHNSEVGKPSFHNDMPPLPEDYTFGAPLKRDPEGAGDVMLTWQSHAPPASKMQYDFGRDFISLNKRCVEKGCINAKDVAGYRSVHDARVKPKVTGKKPAIVPDHVIGDRNHSYGSKSGESEGVADLIQNRYEFEWVEAAKARQERMDRARDEEKRRRMSPARQIAKFKRPPTELSRAQESPKPQDFFTLKQFKNVQSRYRTPSPGAA